ncbi:hypothetical protein [Pararhizobium sp.]|uniref:hypothetical protein n=1 Tax=Pararhizobium sp. TaxID=1977563 RepID=UPI00271995AD|nr:hypothetical protein [Pararhizobium sp.]MDO9417166.1 hypothetical protein [Pararhizobium sp.]
MNVRMTIAAGLVLVLASCTTASVGPANPLKARWVGKSAGEFFAAFGPPLSDVSSGRSTLYSWRGGFRKQKVCAVDLVVGSDYRIDSIKTTRDHPGKDPKGPTHCEEVLDAVAAN